MFCLQHIYLFIYLFIYFKAKDFVKKDGDTEITEILNNCKKSKDTLISLIEKTNQVIRNSFQNVELLQYEQ